MYKFCNPHNVGFFKMLYENHENLFQQK